MNRGPSKSRTRQGKQSVDARRAWIGRVHCAAHALGLDDETRRALQLRVTGVESCARMTVAQLKSVMEALYERGAPRPVREGFTPKASADRAALVAKLEKQCEAQGYPWPNYVLGMSRRMFGEGAPTQVHWHTPDQLRRMVAALAYDQKRRPKAPTPAA